MKTSGKQVHAFITSNAVARTSKYNDMQKFVLLHSQSMKNLKINIKNESQSHVYSSIN
jgi:hypothetical protein